MLQNRRRITGDNTFEFSCGRDRCTSPKQFCKTEENICRYCSRDICLGSITVPLQCDEFCKRYLSSSALPFVVTSESSNHQADSNTSMSDELLISAFWVLCYIAVVVTLILVFPLLKWILKKIKKWYTSTTSSSEEITDMEKIIVEAVEKMPLLRSSIERIPNRNNASMDCDMKSDNNNQLESVSLPQITLIPPPYTSTQTYTGANSTHIDGQHSVQEVSRNNGNTKRQCPESFVTNPEANRDGHHEKFGDTKLLQFDFSDQEKEMNRDDSESTKPKTCC